MADLTKLKRGEENMVNPSSGKGRYLPGINWKDHEEVHYLAFLTPIAEVPRLPIHWVRTPNGWRPFVCRKCEIFEDENPEGACVICDEYVEKNKRYAARNQWMAVAVELTPVEERVNGRKQITGFEILMDEWESKSDDGKEETRSAPHVGLVAQALGNFWTPFTAKVNKQISRTGSGDLDETVYEIQRLGKGKNSTNYMFEAFDPDQRPDLSEFVDNFPRLEDWIEQKGSLEYYDEMLSGGVEGDENDEESEPEVEAQETAQEKAESKFEALAAKLEAREEETVESA